MGGRYVFNALITPGRRLTNGPTAIRASPLVPCTIAVNQSASLRGARIASHPDPFTTPRSAFGFPVWRQVRYRFKPRIKLQHNAKTDMVRLTWIWMVGLTAQELPVSILMRDQKYRAFSPQDVPTAVHAKRADTVSC